MRLPFDPGSGCPAPADGRGPGAEHAERSRSPHCSLADRSRLDLHLGTLAHHSALGAPRVFGGLCEAHGTTGAGEYLCELTYRRGGFVSFRNVREMPEPLPAFPGSLFEQFRKVLGEESIRHLTAVSLQTREHNFGVILFPQSERRLFGSSNRQMLTGLALQIGLTLENYVVIARCPAPDQGI